MTGSIRSVVRQKNMTETLADFPNSAEYVTSTDNRMKALGIYIYVILHLQDSKISNLMLEYSENVITSPVIALP